MKQSGYLRDMERRCEEKYRLAYQQRMDILQQMCVDAAFMAAADVFRMGPGRCEAFGQAMMDYLHELARMMNDDAREDPDLVFTQETVDRRLRKICGEKFEPWEVRYRT